MASPLSKRRLFSLPIQKDLSLRTGDIFFCSGYQLLSKFVQGLTHSIWSHCGFVYLKDGKILFIEADKGKGVKITPAEKFIIPNKEGRLYDGPVVITRCLSLNDKQAEVSVDYALSKVGESFLTKIEVARITLHVFTAYHYQLPKDSWICSSLVERSFYSVGLEIEASLGYITPQDLWRHPSMILLGRIA